MSYFTTGKIFLLPFFDLEDLCQVLLSFVFLDLLGEFFNGFLESGVCI